MTELMIFASEPVVMEQESSDIYLVPILIY